MKLYKYKTNEPTMYYHSSVQVEIPEEYIEKPFRALWVSNVVNIDLPIIEKIEDYQALIIKMLDTCLDYNINAIFFQVRTTNDAFYESKLNPFSRYFTGKEGKKPPFDVMAWIIEEAHQRGIEFHAWCNPYRVSSDGKLTIKEYLETCDDLNFAKQNPHLLVLDKGGKLILNPGRQEVKDFIIASMKELAANYDVDGIHFDDYFYPYAGLHDELNDLADFEKQELPLGDYRRQNVNDVIKGVYHAVHQVKPSIRFGVSPFGIWKNKKENEEGSNTDPACSESFYGQYADTITWMKEKYIDYVVPQIYWEFGHKIAPFADICDYWQDVCRKYNTDLYIGHGAYRYGNEGEFENKYEIVNQVKYANQYETVKGNVFFTYKTFIDTEKSYEGMQELKRLLTKE